MAENLLSVNTAADRLDVSPKTVYRLIYAGLIEPRHIGLGKKKPRVRVAESELERYMASTRTHPPSGPETPPPPPGPKKRAS